MFQQKYQLTNTLLTNITTIERLYGQIEGLKIPKKLELNLTRKNLIKSSYASNKIEGNPLSEVEVTNLLLDDRVPTNRDEKEVVNYFELLKHIEVYKEQPLSLEIIIEFHKRLMTGVDKTAGHIRDVQVVIGKYKEEKGNVSLRVKHNPPFHKRKEIEQGLRELILWINASQNLPTVIQIGLFHHQFVYLHPFEDGNGRVCRLLTALLFIKHSYQINKYFVLDDYYDIDRQQYSDMLHSADIGDKTEWLTYFSEGVMYSLKSALARIKSAMTTLNFEEKPTPKEREVLAYLEEHHEVTSHDIASELNVSRQQAHSLLRSLMDKGLIDKKGITKRSYYFIK